MFNYKILLFIFTCLAPCALALPSERVDSLLQERENQFDGYKQFRSKMEERTWLNLVELDKKANRLIETDRLVVDRLISLSEQERKAHAESVEILKLEKALLERDKENFRQALNEKSTLQRVFLVLILLTSFLAIISFFFSVTIFRRYKSVKLELERLYSGQGDTQTKGSTSNENAIVNQKLSIMKEHNDQLNKELSRLANEKSVAVEALKKEIRDRKKMEQEIKSLIEQVKKQ